MKNIKNKNILITGGTGSFGKKFIELLLMSKTKPNKIIIFSRDELKQYEMSKNKLFFKNKEIIRYFIGDIRDKSRLSFAFKDVDLVVHAAALKHVDIAEYNPFEAIKTNIIGSQNIIDAAISNNVSRVIALSTDKASSPSNLYGATKLCADKLFISANNYIGSQKLKFSVVRYGNVLGSRGSVIPFFLNLPKGAPFTVTDKRMTRFSIGLTEGANFVLNALYNMRGGEIFIPKIPSYRIMDVVKAIDPKRKISQIGIRSGEKLHEQMISIDDAINTLEFNDYYMILPDSEYINDELKRFVSRSIKDKKANYCKDNFIYESKSNNKFLSISEIKKFIKRDLS